MTAKPAGYPAALRDVEARLAALGDELDGLSFFARCGASAGSVAAGSARDYLNGLGLEAMDVRWVKRLPAALALVRRPDTDPRWRAAEERVRAGLADGLDGEIGASRAALLLNEVMRRASEAVARAAGALAADADRPDAVQRAAAGAIIQAAYEAALASAGEGSGPHPFTAKFDLVRAGHWPLAAFDGAFHVY